MENNKDNGELSAKELAPDSLAYELAKSKESENLLGDIRKQTQATLRVLKNWKLEDISRLELNLNKDSERFSKLRETIGTQKKKPIPKGEGEPGANKPQEKRPQEKRPEEKKPQEKRPEEKKPQEKRPSPEQDAKRKADFEKERSTRYRQLRDRGVPADEARRRAYDDTVKAQKYKPEVSAEPPKAKPSKFPFELPKLELPKINLPKFNLPKPQLPKVNLPKPQLPKLKLPELNENQLKRQGFLNKLVGKIFDVKDVFDLGTSAAKRDIGGVLSSGAGLLSNFKKFSPLAYFDAYRKLYEKDVAGAAESAAITRASGSLISRGTGLLARVPALSNLAKAGPYAAAIGGGLLVGSELVKLRKEQDRKEKERIQRQIEALEKAKRGETKMVYPTEFKQGPRNWWESLFPPRMAEGGVVTKPTLALIGEGNEEEYIVPQSKLASFVSSQSNSSVNDDFNKPARIILGVANNFVSQFGSASGDVRRMVGSDILRLERIFGKEKFVLPIFVKGEGSFDNIIGDVFSRLTKFGGSTGGVIPELYDAVDNLLSTLDEFLAEAETMGAGGGELGGGELGGGDGAGGGNVEIFDSGGLANLTPNAKALLNTIRWAEGTAGPKGYVTWFGGRTDLDITKMTISDVVREQKRRLRSGEATYSGITSAAVGAYQMMTPEVFAQRANLNPNTTLFSPEVQDKLAVVGYMKGQARLKDNEINGPISRQLIAKMAGVWASLPNMSGRSQYGQPVKRYEDLENIYNNQLQKFGKTPKQSQSTQSGTTSQSQPNIIAQIYGTRPSISPSSNVFKAENSKNLTSSNLVTKFRASGNAYKSGLGIKEHEGVDFTLPQGTPISFKQGGSILKSRLTSSSDKYANDGYGNVVDVKLNDGKILRLGHLSKVEPWVTVGQKFQANEIVFYSGGQKGASGSGMSDGPHLHLEQHTKSLDYKISLDGKIDPIRNGGASQILIGGTPRRARQTQARPSPSGQQSSASYQQSSLSSNQRVPSGLIMPARGPLTSPYGWRWGRMHKGIDIGGPIGAPIVAPESGKVVYAGFNDGGFGNLVIIQGSKGYHHLAHLDKILTRVGARVSANQLVGKLGTTGRSTGPHLHWEIRTGIMSGGATDPLELSPSGAPGAPSPADTSSADMSSTQTPSSSSQLSGNAPARSSAARAEISRLRRRIPGLNGVPRRRPNRVSALQTPTSLSTTVAVQPVIIQQPVPTQQTASSENIQRTAPRISTNWTPIVVTG